jgi:hypothetical protein
LFLGDQFAMVLGIGGDYYFFSGVSNDFDKLDETAQL